MPSDGRMLVVRSFWASFDPGLGEGWVWDASTCLETWIGKIAPYVSTLLDNNYSIHDVHHVRYTSYALVLVSFLFSKRCNLVGLGHVKAFLDPNQPKYLILYGQHDNITDMQTEI